MNFRLVPVLALALAVNLAATAFLFFDRDPVGMAAEKKTSPPAGPIAQVKTATVRKGAIRETIRVYGYVIPSPGALSTISVPFESRVHRIMVNEGQEVSRGNPLVGIGPSPDTRLKYNQATEAYDTARQALDNMERKFKLKLATNDQVLTARQSFDQARLNLESLKKQGAGEERELRAETAGLVSKVAVDQGAIAAPGAPLLQIVPRDRRELRLGAEPEDIGKVRIGMPVNLSLAIEEAPSVVGAVREVSQSVNASTRLVDVFVSVPSPSRFLLGQYVSGTIVVASVGGLIVPKSAVLPGEKTSVVYIVQDGRAHARPVRTLAEGKSIVAIAGQNVKEGDLVVVVGNYELKDNMRVEVEAGR